MCGGAGAVVGLCAWVIVLIVLILCCDIVGVEPGRRRGGSVEVRSW